MLVQPPPNHFSISGLGFLNNRALWIYSDSNSLHVYQVMVTIAKSFTHLYHYNELPLFWASELRSPRIAAAYLGMDLKLHQDCTILASDLRSPRYSVLQPLLETPLSAIVFILQPEVMFVGVVMDKT